MGEDGEGFGDGLGDEEAVGVVAVSDPLITFYNAAGSKRVVTVGEIVPDLKALPHSTSGRPWGRVLGFQSTGQLVIVLDDEKVTTLDPEAK